MLSCWSCRLFIETFIKYKHFVFIALLSVIISADFKENELMKLSENEILTSANVISKHYNVTVINLCENIFNKEVDIRMGVAMGHYCSKKDINV